MVPLPCSPSSRRAPSTTSRTSFTPAVTADRGTNCLAVAVATTEARVVLPVPGGPHRMAEVSRSDSMSARSGAPGPTRCCWPMISSSVRGRSRAARGPGRPAAPRPRRRTGRSPATGSAPVGSGMGRSPRSASAAGRHRLRGAGHRVRARLGLREGDDLADAVLAGEDGHQPVDAHGEPGVGRRAVAEGPEQEPEAGLRLLVPDPEHGEHPALDVGAVDPDAARSQLPAVEHQVVGLGPHRGGVGLEPVEVLGVGHGERVVGGHRVARVVHAVEHREVHHPQVAVRALADRPAAELHPQLAEHGAGQPVLVGHHQDQVAGGGAGGRQQARPLRRRTGTGRGASRATGRRRRPR